MRRPRPGAASAALPVLFCLLSLALLAPRAGAHEVGGDPDAASAPVLKLPPVGLDVSVTADWRVFDDDDLDATYGSLPVFGVEVALTVAEKAAFFAGVGFAKSTGDPYYDRPEFDGGEAELQAVPVTLGLRGDFSDHPRIGLLGSVGVEAAWIEETLPSGDPWNGPGRVTDDGWIRGLFVSFGPEWRSADGGRAAGLTFRLGGASGDVGHRYDGHRVSLQGMGVRFHLTHTFGRGGAS